MKQLDIPDKPLVGIIRASKRQNDPRVKVGEFGVAISTREGSFALDTLQEIAEVPGLKKPNRNLQAYYDMLAAKHVTNEARGFEVAPEAVHQMLYRFQRDIVRWACQLGRAAIFADVGLGKSFMQVEIARLVTEHTKGRALILTPLAVAHQTVKEAAKLGVEIAYCEDGDQAGDSRIVITNFDRVEKFNLDDFTAVLIDESGILKHYSKTFFKLTELCENVPYRYCFTATPAPNDFVELGNHAMFLGIMHFKDMLARWFVGEGDVARKARLAHYAVEDFWRWMTTWAVCISKPSDLGDEYDMPGYEKPVMHIHEHRLSASQAAIQRAWDSGKLVPDDAPSATQFMKVKRESLPDRVEKSLEIVAGIPADDPVILWCHTDFEADALQEAFPEAVEVRGSQTREHKRAGLESFSDGHKRAIITKPELAGFGLNWQHCNQMIFTGVSYSFEEMYQAIGRIRRYGQQRDVHVHLIYSETEGNVVETLKTKQGGFAEMQEQMSRAVRKYGLFREDKHVVFTETETSTEHGKDWAYHLGDCVIVMADLPDNSVDLTVSSIPFSNLYVYSDKAADVGNSADKEEFFQHMRYVIQENHRITTPGRCCAIHVKDLPLFQNRDSVMGIDPFSDDTAAAYRALRTCTRCDWVGFPDGKQACPECDGALMPGWVLQSRITIEKDPVIEMEKTNSHGLLFKNWRERAEILRVGLPDYVLVFQKPGDAPEKRVRHDPLDVTYYGENIIAEHRYPKYPKRGGTRVDKALPIWQEYANPNWSDVVVPLVWTDINQMDVLNYLVAKADKDQRHICPLQLDLIARLIQWKSNPGDVVFDPFGGIASTGVKALEMGRKFVGAELKPEYHALGVKYLKEAELLAARPKLPGFDAVEVSPN